MNNEYKLLNDPEYREQWVKEQPEQSTEYFLDQLEIKDKYICDCHRNHGKDCLFPEKYRKEGCS